MSAKSLRLRVFAGPNGSGKSTIIQSVKSTKAGSNLLEIGQYINADDIAVRLAGNSFSFTDYDVTFKAFDFCLFALNSGLLNNFFTLNHLKHSCVFENNAIYLKDRMVKDKIAQITARFLRELMLREGRRFSFETVFSHPSNVDIMRQAAALGYKVYLYFVATESPEINKLRVTIRSQKGGHNVPPEYIEKRYYRSLDLLYDACETCYQAFFFDNSVDNAGFRLIANFKAENGNKVWQMLDRYNLPEWFKKYYSEKMP
jgi:predicted ABC-type ATPase